MSTELKNEDKKPHPCQYCQKPCFGYQCKECHFKMIKDRQAICMDCNKTFYGMRKNGTFRKRCTDCQDNYNKKYICKCITCNNDFHAYLDDGRVFDRCLDCYKKSFKKCDRCDNNTREEYSLCKVCYIDERNNLDEPRILT